MPHRWLTFGALAVLGVAIFFSLVQHVSFLEPLAGLMMLGE